jgi:hypothetical protein
MPRGKEPSTDIAKATLNYSTEVEQEGNYVRLRQERLHGSLQETWTDHHGVRDITGK